MISLTEEFDGCWLNSIWLVKNSSVQASGTEVQFSRKAKQGFCLFLLRHARVWVTVSGVHRIAQEILPYPFELVSGMTLFASMIRNGPHSLHQMDDWHWSGRTSSAQWVECTIRHKPCKPNMFLHHNYSYVFCHIFINTLCTTHPKNTEATWSQFEHHNDQIGVLSMNGYTEVHGYLYMYMVMLHLYIPTVVMPHSFMTRRSSSFSSRSLESVMLLYLITRTGTA